MLHFRNTKNEIIKAEENFNAMREWLDNRYGRYDKYGNFHGVDIICNYHNILGNTHVSYLNMIVGTISAN